MPPFVDSFATRFASSPSAFRGKPFWAWNGQLQREELLRQVRIFAEMGMGGFFMHSRTGLTTEYLGDEWFECVNACADEAERLGLEAWLYDEDRWPSGSAGGLATQDPAFRMKVLRLRIVPPAALTWPDSTCFVAAFAARVEGLAFKDVTPLLHGAAAPDNRPILLFTTEAWEGHSFYNGFTYLDTLSREATENFLRLTHERYRERCGDRLGKAIRGIFTDEPHHGTVLCENNENRTMPDQQWTLPWTPRLWEEFSAEWGYDLREHLPELFLQPGGRRVSRVKWHYMELLQRMFLKNWAEPLHRWCQENGLELTGHLLHEDSLVAQAVPGGSVMRGYEFFDVPGVDVLAVENRCFWIVKQLASVARQMGRKWMLSELYGCTGWQLDFAGHKRIGLWQALLGINVRCHHLAWYTMEGEAKRDYPASISFQSAWWREYRAVEDFFARLNVALQQGERICEVLVINPIESTWAQIHPGWAQWLGALDPALEALEQTYRQVFHWLTAAHIDFDYGDEDHLARFGSVQTGPSGPVLQLGEATYRTVVVAGMVTIRGTTLALLRRFQEAGGSVVFAGDAPGHLDAEPSATPEDFAAGCRQTALTPTDLVAAVEESATIPLHIRAPETVLCQLRRDGERWIVAVANACGEHSAENVSLALPGPWKIEEWKCESGDRVAVTASSEDDRTAWKTHIPPIGLRLFVLAPELVRETKRTIEGEPMVTIEPIPGPFAYELDEPNVCVLDQAEIRIGDDDHWEPAREILEIDASLRERFGLPQRSGDMVQPWAVALQPQPDSPGTRIELRFRVRVEQVPNDTELLLERPKRWAVTLNGVELPSSHVTGWHFDPSMQRVPVPAERFRLGENELVLTTQFTHATNLEAIYLLGEFGVRCDASGANIIIGLPPRIRPSDVCDQGLPFYSGRITYHLPAPSQRNADESLELVLGRFGGACARCPENQTVAWPPYSSTITETETDIRVEVLLTRRNTFGPLHLVPREQPHIGPMSFRSKGATFSRSYVLEPAGLLQAPVYRRIRRRC